MHIAADLKAVLEAVRREGGRPHLVGGCVRDWKMGKSAKDFDIEVGGVDFEALHRALAPFGATDVVGRSFGVVKLRMDGAEYDFSLPRRESKSGSGHRGFHIQPEPGLGDREAAARRDFTINSMAYDPFSGALIDPFGGERDLAAGVLRHTSEAFVEDPLRVLRAMQFAARFDLELADETATLCASISDTCRELPVERVWAEWEKWATKSTHPSRGLEVLVRTRWITHFPEIAALKGTPQEEEWHPEGDVFVHTQHCLNALVGSETWEESPDRRRRILSLAVLAHDFGKPATTRYMDRRGVMRWTSHGHEAAGGPLAESFLQRIGAPRDLHEPVRALVVHHLLHHHQEAPTYTDTQLRRLARRLMPATVEDLCEVMRADACGRPPMNPAGSLRLITEMRDQAHILCLRTEAPQPLLQGRHLIALGMTAGPHFKPLLDAAFEAQLDGLFNDEKGAFEWAVARVSQKS
jgi:tRNA nucleotidyltransferase (CCA-adding enzyme)